MIVCFLKMDEENFTMGQVWAELKWCLVPLTSSLLTTTMMTKYTTLGEFVDEL